MNKPEVKFPLPQEKIFSLTLDVKNYIKYITHELKQSLMDLELIQDWCSHPATSSKSEKCNVCQKVLTEEKENV
jgi:hypothetical protein